MRKINIVSFIFLLVLGVIGCSENKYDQYILFNSISFKMPPGAMERKEEEGSLTYYEYEYPNSTMKIGISLLLIDGRYENNEEFLIEMGVTGPDYISDTYLAGRRHKWGIDVLFIQNVKDKVIIEEYYFAYHEKRFGIRIELLASDKNVKEKEEFLNSVEIKGIE